VAVGELGTEAAGATEIEMLVTGKPSVREVMRVDRPFLFLIRDGDQGTILFLGRVVNPAT
jgi:serine protease inhibitor